MELAQEAFSELHAEKAEQYQLTLSYSGRFKAYNAHIVKRGRQLTINMSKQWRSVDRDIKKGLIQSLLVKMLKIRKKTTSIDLYDIFLRSVHIAVPKTKVDPTLALSFERVNEKYFSNAVELPNLVWGTESYRTMGSYTYGNDTISISKVLLDAQPELIDYVMHHEMLHKKHKFHTTHGRSYHHTKVFRQGEKQFDNHEAMEKSLDIHIRKRKRAARRMHLFG